MTTEPWFPFAFLAAGGVLAYVGHLVGAALGRRHRAEPRRPMFWQQAMDELDVLDGTREPDLPCWHTSEPEWHAIYTYGAQLIRTDPVCTECGKPRAAERAREARQALRDTKETQQ